MQRKYKSNKDETVRMFENNFMEALSKVHPSVPLLIFLPVISFFLYRSVLILKISQGAILGMFVSGIFIWSLTEYILHRFIFHFVPASQFGKKLHFIFHGVHHDYPNDSRRLVMPPSVSIPLAALFYIFFQNIVGAVLTAPFFAGFISGYLFYDMTHYAIHHFNIRSKFWLALKKHHYKHHYLNSESGFGVSSAMWDIIFNTGFETSEKTDIFTVSEQGETNS